MCLSALACSLAHALTSPCARLPPPNMCRRKRLVASTAVGVAGAAAAFYWCACVQGKHRGVLQRAPAPSSTPINAQQSLASRRRDSLWDAIWSQGPAAAPGGQEEGGWPVGEGEAAEVRGLRQTASVSSSHCLAACHLQPALGALKPPGGCLHPFCTQAATSGRCHEEAGAEGGLGGPAGLDASMDAHFSSIQDTFVPAEVQQLLLRLGPTMAEVRLP